MDLSYDTDNGDKGQVSIHFDAATDSKQLGRINLQGEAVRRILLDLDLIHITTCWWLCWSTPAITASIHAASACCSGTASSTWLHQPVCIADSIALRVRAGYALPDDVQAKFSKSKQRFTFK